MCVAGVARLVVQCVIAMVQRAGAACGARGGAWCSSVQLGVQSALCESVIAAGWSMGQGLAVMWVYCAVQKMHLQAPVSSF
jgi:hypothetical protein